MSRPERIEVSRVVLCLAIGGAILGGGCARSTESDQQRVPIVGASEIPPRITLTRQTIVLRDGPRALKRISNDGGRSTRRRRRSRHQARQHRPHSRRRSSESRRCPQGGQQRRDHDGACGDHRPHPERRDHLERYADQLQERLAPQRACQAARRSRLLRCAGYRSALLSSRWEHQRWPRRTTDIG